MMTTTTTTTTTPVCKTITHSASGARCSVYDIGATVTSFQTASGRECLFLSREAKLDGTKAIRGGIPLVFPQFGQPDKSMPQHGFLRNNLWKFDDASAYDTQESAGIKLTLELKDVKNARGGDWSDSTAFDCQFIFKIQVEAETMTTTLEIHNTSADSESFPFQTLQHTYLRVDNQNAYKGSKTFVEGLEGYVLTDKISNEPPRPWGKEPVTLSDLTDRVYSPPEGQDEVIVKVGVGGDKNIKLVASGVVSGKTVPVSCVVWNPWKENAASMGDFGDDQWVDMICVEPGILGSPTLPAGGVATLTQTISLI